MKILTKVMDLLALSVILSFMILMFSGCQMASGTLSEKEITVFNTEFFNGDISFLLMIRRPPRSTPLYSSAASVCIRDR